MREDIPELADTTFLLCSGGLHPKELAKSIKSSVSLKKVSANMLSASL